MFDHGRDHAAVAFDHACIGADRLSPGRLTVLAPFAGRAPQRITEQEGRHTVEGGRPSSLAIERVD